MPIANVCLQHKWTFGIHYRTGSPGQLGLRVAGFPGHWVAGSQNVTQFHVWSASIFLGSQHWRCPLVAALRRRQQMWIEGTARQTDGQTDTRPLQLILCGQRQQISHEVLHISSLIFSSYDAEKILNNYCRIGPNGTFPTVTLSLSVVCVSVCRAHRWAGENCSPIEMRSGWQIHISEEHLDGGPYSTSGRGNFMQGFACDLIWMSAKIDAITKVARWRCGHSTNYFGHSLSYR